MNIKKYDLIITGAEGDIGPQISEYFESSGRSILRLDLQNGNDLTNEHYVKKIFQESRAPALINLFAKNEHVLSGEGHNSEMAKSIYDFDLEDLNEYFRVNLTALFSVCREYAKNNKIGSIVNFASIYGLRPPLPSLYLGGYKHIGYSTSKASVIALTEYLAVVLAPSIRINVVAPGGIGSNQNQSFVQRYSNKCPMQRMALTEDLFGILELLISSNSSYITGSTFRVDGGWTLV